jgi:predicted acylesterase/phospholipase RssA
MSGLLHTALALAVAALIAGCSLNAPQRLAAPEADYLLATPLGVPAARVWGDQAPENIDELTEARKEVLRQRYAVAGRPAEGLDVAYLALSGGGPDGAYGAGVLTAWTQSGDRPQFDMVTGVSTGALIAPFAFLGPDYDDALTEAYTEITTDDIAVLQIFAALFGALGIADTSPLQALIARHVDEAMLDRIAEEYGKGRYLLVGTTNLDAQRPVIWNIGEIAASNAPNRLELARQVILASASIPGAFAPVAIDVVSGDKRYQELHVDGGVTAAVFLLPLAVRANEAADVGFPLQQTVYVIQNNKLRPGYAPAPPSLLQIVSRSVSSLIRTQGAGDVLGIYFTAQRDAMDFRLSYVPADFDETSEGGFDPVYMRRLFDLGQKRLLSGEAWTDRPPQLPKPDEAEPGGA